MVGAGDSQVQRKARGAFFTPPAIANYLAAWAIAKDPEARVLDPTCGEAVFLLAAARELHKLGASPDQLDQRVFGVDVHGASLREAQQLLEAEGLDACLVESDFFELLSPMQLGSQLPAMDAVIGNPPFVRYQDHAGNARKASAAAALAQGVRLTGLASSWAASLVHASAFLQPEGRLAMVLPAELLTVHYAEPIRRWLRQRFAAVNLVLFESLQFSDATEKVVLLCAQGSGGCDAFNLLYAEDAQNLTDLHPFDGYAAAPAQEGKWTDLLLPIRQRQLFKRVTNDQFVSLETFGSPELGAVTGANAFFTLSEETRLHYGLTEQQVVKISPPGTKHLRGLSFTERQWNDQRDAGDAVWLLHPPVDDETPQLRRYLRHGEALGVPKAYKCTVREPWWRPPTVRVPDLFFTYMSHRYPRLITNSARVTLVNSMHGVTLRPLAPRFAKAALPLLSLNSVTMLGAEVHGRSYGGGVLKMEPREAASLPVPSPAALEAAWVRLRGDKASLDRQLRQGLWTNVVKLVDRVLLHETIGLEQSEVTELHTAARSLRERRIGREVPDA